MNDYFNLLTQFKPFTKITTPQPPPQQHSSLQNLITNYELRITNYLMQCETSESRFYKVLSSIVINPGNSSSVVTQFEVQS